MLIFLFLTPASVEEYYINNPSTALEVSVRLCGLFHIRSVNTTSMKKGSLHLIIRWRLIAVQEEGWGELFAKETIRRKDKKASRGFMGDVSYICYLLHIYTQTITYLDIVTNRRVFSWLMNEIFKGIGGSEKAPSPKAKEDSPAPPVPRLSDSGGEEGSPERCAVLSYSSPVEPI
jgi:hypothetical protein